MNSRQAQAHNKALLAPNFAKTGHLFSFRGVRHKVGAGKDGHNEQESSSSESSSSSSSSTDDKESSTNEEKTTPDPMKFIEKLQDEYFKKGIVGQKDHVEFTEKFNRENAGHGYKVELIKENVWLGPVLVVAVPLSLLFLMYKFMPRNVIPEHRTVLEQMPVNFDEFLRDYLTCGEVQSIFYYPIQRKAVAILHPGAIIRGQPFDLPGVHVSLDEKFRTDPRLFINMVRNAESRMGIDQREQVQIGIRHSLGSPIIYMIGWSLLFFVFFSNWKRMVTKILFRIVPTGSKKI